MFFVSLLFLTSLFPDAFYQRKAVGIKEILTMGIVATNIIADVVLVRDSCRGRGNNGPPTAFVDDSKTP
jgi:hypothetical protein